MLAQASPTRITDRETLMIGFGVSLVEFILATFAPIFVGMFLLVTLSNATHVDIRYLSAYALGLLFWFFFDTLGDAAQLDVNQGFSFDSGHIGLMALFIIGFLVFTLLGGALSSKDRKIGCKDTSFLLAALVALGMGCHGVGEGIEFGGLSAGTQATNVLDAIGGINGGVGYMLHKLLESTIVIVVFIALARANGLQFPEQMRQTAVISLVFGIPSVLGEVAGYLIPINSSWFYALGAGVSLFVVLQICQISAAKKEEVTYSQWVRISVAMILGFFLLYAAALFHS
ncbi:MAG TPA: hypothetical protein VEG61_07870 [Candidatus Dormibacteraeota bacterium]|nr:hypothetical protein [Candidatus Dormibacteraeota bacterium]